MAELAALKMVISGRVQGVMFRDFTRQQASGLGLTGYVRNLPDGNAVEVEAEGNRDNLEKLLSMVKRGPPRAEVKEASVTWSKYTGTYPDFNIKF